MFASVTYNFYSLGDFSMLADVYGGVWKIKQSQINSDNINYEPFFNVGLMFQTTFSKYFKGYIRPSFEMRSCCSSASNGAANPYPWSWRKTAGTRLRCRPGRW